MQQHGGNRLLVLGWHNVDSTWCFPAPAGAGLRGLARQLRVLRSVANVVPLAAALADLTAGRSLPPRAVAITFDDGFANVADEAAPLLLERGLTATVFCVASRIGGRSDWGSQPRWAPRLPLLGAAELRELAGAGWEIGSHGLTHTALPLLSESDVARELSESKRVLEQTVQHDVRSFAYPYGVVPPDASAALRDAEYEAACTIRVAAVREGMDPFALPRVDAHYLRRPRLLRSALAGRSVYVTARGLGARARRLVRSDVPGPP